MIRTDFVCLCCVKFFCEDGQYSAMGTLLFITPEESIKNLFHLPESKKVNNKNYMLEYKTVFLRVFLLKYCKLSSLQIGRYK